MSDDRPQTTDGDRAAAALKAAGETAFRNSNMGQAEAYRINHVISLIERVRAEERERCAAVADNYARDGRLCREYACEVADEIAARIRSGG